MTDEAPRHFASPFAFGPDGTVNTVEQDSPAEIASCVFNIVVCPLGFRIEQPDFGVDDVAFSPQPVDVTGLIAQAQQWEPRAEITAEYTDQLEVLLTTGQAGGTPAAPGESDITLIVAPSNEETTQ